MNEFYENVAAKSNCSECGKQDMGIAYVYESGGLVKKPGEALGIKAYIGAGNMLIIVCKACGFVEKSFVIAKGL